MARARGKATDLGTRLAPETRAKRNWRIAVVGSPMTGNSVTLTLTVTLTDEWPSNGLLT